MRNCYLLLALLLGLFKITYPSNLPKILHLTRILSPSHVKIFQAIRTKIEEEYHLQRIANELLRKKYLNQINPEDCDYEERKRTIENDYLKSQKNNEINYKRKLKQIEKKETKTTQPIKKL